MLAHCELEYQLQSLRALHASAVARALQGVGVPEQVPPHSHLAASQSACLAIVEQAAMVPWQACTPESGPPRWHQRWESQMVPVAQSSSASHITVQTCTPVHVV